MKTPLSSLDVAVIQTQKAFIFFSVILHITGNIVLELLIKVLYVITYLQSLQNTFTPWHVQQCHSLSSTLIHPRCLFKGNTVVVLLFIIFSEHCL